MKLRILAFTALTFVSTIGCQRLITAVATPVILQEESERNEKAVLRYVWPVLKSSGKAARIYYAAVCHSNEDYAAFPWINAQPPPSGKTGLAAIQGIFRNDKSVDIREDETGIIRIKLGNVPDTILHTRISFLRLDASSQYNATVAIEAIEESNEVQAAARKLNIHIPVKVYNMLLVQPAEGEPHLPASMMDVTMDEALDLVAMTFKGVVLYGACVQPGLIDTTFTGGIYFDDRSLDTVNGSQSDSKQ